MKRKIVFFLFAITIFCNSFSQKCISSFTTDIKIQISIIKKREPKAIHDFMKVGYKLYPERKLQEKNVMTIPIYCLLYKKKYYHNDARNVKEILCYVDTKRFYIDEILFYKDSTFYGSAYSAYSNYYDQPFGKSVYNANLAQIILDENPDLIFTIGQTNGYYVFLKDNSLYIFSMFYNPDKKYLKYQIDDFINNYLDDADLIFGTDYSPSIYAK
ncbi:MAG: hypothetical protein VB102_13065 [Paludibacter sp.]|nr:hypothetical protein [Paludibacter sp.]